MEKHYLVKSKMAKIIEVTLYNQRADTDFSSFKGAFSFVRLYGLKSSSDVKL